MLLLRDREAFSAVMPRGTVAEIGVHEGRHAEIILKYCKPKLLYLIDPWERQETGVHADDPTNCNELPTFYESLSRKYFDRSDIVMLRRCSLEASSSFPDGFFDWVYLDADHTLDAVRADLRAWWPKIKAGGFLCGHDYILETYKQYPYIQVREAVDEFLGEQKLSLYALTEEKYASWAVRKELLV